LSSDSRRPLRIAREAKDLLPLGVGRAGGRLGRSRCPRAQLGLDSNQDWGPSRYPLLGVGVLIMASSWLGDVLRILGAGAIAGLSWARRTMEGFLARSGAAEPSRRLVPADGNQVSLVFTAATRPFSLSPDGNRAIECPADPGTFRLGRVFIRSSVASMRECSSPKHPLIGRDQASAP
jgi:hypothetical protein